MNDLKTMSIYQLLGTLTAYEMRIRKDKNTTREASFKVYRKTDFEMDEIEAKIVRRLKTRSGKYKGKLPFKCFNCGKVGHFASKCPYKKIDQNHVDEEKHSFKRYNRNDKYKQKGLCANDVDSSEVSDSGSSCEDKKNEFMLMAIEDFDIENEENDMNDEDVVVDMEGILLSALEEIDRLKLKKRKQKQLLIQYENNDKEANTDCTW